MKLNKIKDRKSLRSSIGDSALVGSNTRYTVGASVGNSIGISVDNLLCTSVWFSIRDSVWRSVVPMIQKKLNETK